MQNGIAAVPSCIQICLSKQNLHDTIIQWPEGEFPRGDTKARKASGGGICTACHDVQARLLVGVGSASLLAVGANFAGLTSFLLGLAPESGRNLKLDVLYPIEGYSCCIENNEGFG